MSKHSTTPRTLSRRLAALLAALALLAAMALPVYAEALDGATGTAQAESNGTAGTAQAEIGDTISDGTVTTESDSTTPEGKEAAEDSTANADGNNASENKDTKDNASSSTTGDSNTTADDTVNDTPQTLPADNIDTTAGKTATNDTLDTTDEDTKQDSVTQPTDDAATDDDAAADNEIAANSGTYPAWVYVAVGDDFKEGWTVKFNSNMAIKGDNWLVMQSMVEQLKPYNGRKVFGFELTEKNCPNGGYSRIQFFPFDSSGNKQNNFYEASNKWMGIDDFANKLYDAKEKKWVNNYKPFDPTNHTAFSGKKMAFKNASTDALTNVVAHFYEKNADGKLIEVERQNLNNNVPAGEKVDFTIPPENKPCGFIQFTAGDSENNISSLYNFYGQTGDGESFLYNEETQFCFVYNTNSMAHWGTGEGRTIYYDATFSKLSVDTDYSIPSVGGNVYYYAYNEGTSSSHTGKMTSFSDDVYAVDIPEDCDKIIFASYQSISPSNLAGLGNSTDVLTIPTETEYKFPCYYADTSDACTYGGRRDGYWAEYGTFRNAEKQKKGNSVVVNVPESTFTADSKTKYIDTTLYDYYTDWELNGNNRDSYAKFNTNETNKFACHRNWVTFGQFDQALSDYYSKSGAAVAYPMYTGQFQPEATGDDGKDWGLRFNDIAYKLNLYGYNENDKNKFMAVNNSTIDVNGTGLKSNQTKYYDDAFQGLTGNELVNGEPVLYDTKLTVPYFNKDFLLKSNSKNAKLGEVYDNVSFPLTKDKGVFNGNNEDSVEYWYFDSNKTTLYLKQDTGNKGYFLQNSNNRAGSRNLKSSSEYQDTETYGFFPFNEDSTNQQASTYNYGFGAKLKFQFTMNEDGQVYGTDGKTKVPIKFFFSGDDDVWVYIDDELALDVGGDHGKVSGLLEFGQNKKGDLVYTPYVSDVKASNTGRMYTEARGCKSVKYLSNTKTFNYKGTEKPITPGTHTLTMYYMERGMWESNMAIAFNFPDHNELQVEKKVDLTDVNDIFKSSFQNRELFAFTIQNQATHYGAKEADSTGEVKTETVDLKSAKLTTTTTDTSSGNIFTQAPDPDANTGQALHWYAPYTDTSSSHRGDRYGILTLGKPIDISNMKYLTFKLYVKSAEGQSTPSITNMYLELLDNQSPPKQKGGVNKASLGGTTYGVVTMAEDKWITVKLDLDKLTAQDGFDSKNVQTIRFGCNYPRDIYLKDFTFTSAVPDVVQVGFTTKQDQIPDYGSATSGKLENATNARFTSSNKTKGTQVVDKDGKFLLADGETVTFTDQFRRGSYISLNEELNDKLFDTSWTLYENDVPVTTMVAGSKVEIPSPVPKLKDVNSSGPDDGRKENKGTDTESTNKYSDQKPTTANTIVFRSYSNPDAGVDAAFTKLKVKCVNKVKTGSLTIKKEAASGETLSGTYTFTVTYTNVGGLGLESEGITQTVEIQGTNAKTITGIPLGTRFRVEETGRNDDSHLQGVTFTYCDDGAVIDNKQVHGTITARKDGQTTTVTFTNTMRELFDLTLTKQWKDANGKDLTTNLPKQIYVQLQRQKAGDTTWKAVQYPKDSNLNYVTIAPDNSGWHYLFVGLDRTDVSDTTNNDKPKWKYRVVEGTLGSDGTFTPLAEGETILLKGNVYTVAGGGEETTDENKNTSATLTNKRLNPKFKLDILKKSADEPETPLKGVEFKLEKLTADGNAVDEKFTARIGITNAQGEVEKKGPDGNATEKDIFHDLEAGAYRLTETKAAENYNLLSAPILVTFGKDGTCTLNGSKIEVSTTEKRTEFTKNEDGSYTLALTVLNRKTPALPHTGADAPSLWLLIGLPLAVAGLLILVFRYNKKGGRTR